MSNEAKCSCQFCNGHIAFNSAMAGQNVACPHCGMETKLFVPHVAKAPASKPPQNVSVEIKRGVSPLGIASLVLGIIACIFCWIPLLGLLVLPLALIGLLLAIVGLVMAGVSKKTEFAFPVSGLIVCLLSAFLAIAIMGSIAKAFVKGHQTNQEQVSNSNNKSDSSGEWAKSAVVKQGDIKVSIKRVTVPSGAPMQITLSVANLSTTKKIDFTGWSGVKIDVDGSSASLTDNNQNNYKRITEGMAPNSTIYPQQEASDTIAFETPVENIQWLHLELPARNFGGSGMLRFEISNDKIIQIRKALAYYASFVANNGYLTNADYVKVAEKHKALEQYYENLQKQSQTPAQKAAVVKMWNETILPQWNALDAQLATAQQSAITSENNKVAAAESNFDVP